jgi:hypothetical protein
VRHACRCHGRVQRDGHMHLLWLTVQHNRQCHAVLNCV